MKRKDFFVVFYALSLIIGLAFAFGIADSGTKTAYAATIPTLTLSVESPGYTQLSVNADANAPVYLYYYVQNGTSQTETSGILGTTNAYGYFSTTLNDNTYTIPYNAPVYVTVDGQNSATVDWPANSYTGTGGTGTYGSLTLSQTNVNLQVGQTITITASNNSYNYNYDYQPLTVTGNTNPTAVSATTNSSSQVTITGINYGSAIITVCESNTSVCGTVYVNVSSSIINQPEPYPVPTPIIYSQPLSFSTNNVSMNADSSQTIQIYGSGNYYIYQNSNPVVVTANLEGNWLSLEGIQAGTSNITVCENNANTSCAVIYADVISNQITYPVYTTYPTYYYQPVTITYPTYPVQQPINYYPWGRQYQY